MIGPVFGDTVEETLILNEDIEDAFRQSELCTDNFWLEMMSEDYYSADGTEQDPCENSLAPNCTGPTYNSDVITQESSDEQVRQLVLTTLAIAIVPTVIGILLLAYRMKW